METASVIYLIDDDEDFRNAVALVLRTAGYEVRTFASAGDFLLTTPEDGPGCILLDIKMPGPSGLELQKALASQPDRLPIIFLTGFGDIPSSITAMKEGAFDFLTKPVEKGTLLTAVSKALVRDIQNRVIRERLRPLRSSYQSLTNRERQVFARVVAGRRNKQIAAELGTTERTVKAHRARVMDKMKVGSFAELVHVADVLQVRTEA
jgi:FixJ family two-component response regulator